MIDRRWVTLGLRKEDFAVFLGYIAMLCAVVPFHEPWADEAQAWLVSRDLGIYSLLIRNLRYEGHPALWYLVLWVPTHLHMSYAYFNWFSAGLASGGIYLLLRFAPFPFYLRALLPFSFFLGYQYSVVARDYVLFPMLAFLIAHVYRQERQQPVLMAVLLALLANLSLQGTLVAIGFAVCYRWDLLKRGDRSGKTRELYVGAGVFAGSLVLVAVCLWPAKDMTPQLSPGLMKILYRVAVDGITTSPPPDFTARGGGRVRAVAAVPTASPIGVQRASVAQLSANPGVSRLRARLGGFVRVLGYAFAPWTAVAFAFHALLLVHLYRRKELKLLLPVTLLVLFLVFVYGAEWHLGLLWIVAVMVLWVTWDERVGWRELRLQSVMAASLGALCVQQLPWTVHAIRYDRAEPTAAAKEAAAYLHTVGDDKRIAGFDRAFSVLPYFSRNIFFNQHRESFVHYAYDDSLPSAEQVIAAEPDLFVLDRDDALVDKVVAAGYRETHFFCGGTYVPKVPDQPVCLTILERQ